MSVHTDVKNATRKSVIFFLNASGSFLWFDAKTIRPMRLKNAFKIGAFAHVSGAAEVTVKHNLGALKHKTVLPSTHT